VKWEVVECCTVTVMAQQMQDDKDEYTFRQWNPEKTHAAWGEDNSSPVDRSCPMFCVCCVAVEFIFKAVF